MTAAYELISESEEPGCWVYVFDMRDESGSTSRHRLRLAWADYDLWVRDGTVEPTRVADAILRFVLPHPAFSPLPLKIDSSHPRRLDANADHAIPALIRDIAP